VAWVIQAKVGEPSINKFAKAMAMMGAVFNEYTIEDKRYFVLHVLGDAHYGIAFAAPTC